MTALSVTLMTFFCCLIGYALGGLLEKALPESELSDRSREVLKDATAMIATLAALVLGLLVTSAKATFDKSADRVSESGAKLIEVDRILRHFGTEGDHARDRLRRYTELLKERLELGQHPTAGPEVPETERAISVDDMMARPIRALEASTDELKDLKSDVLDTVKDLARTRWEMIEESYNPLPKPFLILMFFWLGILFLGFGIVAPVKPTVVVAMILCAASVSGAVYLIMEMNRPLSGALRIPTMPLRLALDIMDNQT